MDLREPDFTIGIEEEYLLVDKETCDIARVPDGLMDACRHVLSDQVSPEFLQCQIEVGTKVCGTVADARTELQRLRGTVAEIAGREGLAPIAVSCHPFADWRDQIHTDKARYRELERTMAAVVRRMLVCGMHVHVGVPDPDVRVDLMNQMAYFLPHLLALSCSSPYWQGFDTGLCSYRTSVFGNMPRTGLPPQFWDWSEYERSLEALTDVGVIEDGSKIWWDLRPSSRFPTLETRVCDVMPRMEDALSIAATIQCLTRMLWRLRSQNLRWRVYDRFLIGENRWRAQRFGTSEGLIDLGRRQIVPFAELVEELIDLIAEDAAALHCEAEVAHLREMVARGSSADRQRRVYAGEREMGADHDAGMRAVVHQLIGEFTEGL